MGRRGKGTRYSGDPWRRLAAAVILRAVHDAEAGNGEAAEARAWLRSGECAAMLDALDIDVGRAGAWVRSQGPVMQMELPGIW
jgi:hypothetical protein